MVDDETIFVQSAHTGLCEKNQGIDDDEVENDLRGTLKGASEFHLVKVGIKNWFLM